MSRRFRLTVHRAVGGRSYRSPTATAHPVGLEVTTHGGRKAPASTPSNGPGSQDLGVGRFC